MEDSYLTKKSSSNSIVKKAGDSTIPAKNELRRNDILDKLMQTIYRLGNSQRAR